MKSVFADLGAFAKKHKIFTIVTAVILAVIIVVVSVFCTILNPELYADRYSDGILPNATEVKNAVTYKRIVIFGIDGAGGYFGEDECEAENYRMIFGGGATTYTGIAQYPSSSAQNWTSMMHGVMYQKHLVTNEIAASSNYINNKYPSFFKVYSEKHPSATFSSIVSWKPLNKGIIEQNISGMTKLSAADYLSKNATHDEKDKKVLALVKERFAKVDDTVSFIHFDNVDHMGHTYGYGSKEYREAIKTVDGYLGEIYQVLEDNDKVDDTLFILVTDHGHRLNGGHGKNSSTEKNTTLAINGNKGNIINGTIGKYVTQDLAAIVMYALGETQPSSWQSRVPYNIFNTLPTKGLNK